MSTPRQLSADPTILPATLPVRTASRAERLESVDFLRGAVMLVMGLDHTREFFTNLPFPPENLARSFPALFFTRWITHFCAPAFFFLAGTGAFLALSRGKSIQTLSSFLWKRGLWLVLLELTVMDFFFTFTLRYQVGVVLWALGWSMVALALLIRLPTWLTTTLSAAMILFHNLFDNLQAGAGAGGYIIRVLHVPFIELRGGHFIGALYPLVPWIGVMALGYVVGRAYRTPTHTRRRLFIWLGAALTIAFVGLRATNWYGDPNPWTHQSTWLMTACSFLNCTKYPPSLCFLLMTLGPLILLLGLLDGRRFMTLRPVLIYGRVPLFFFVGHILVVHLLAIVVALISRQPVAWLFHGAALAKAPEGYGHGLPFIYAIWITAMLIMYPICVWYANVKRRSANPLLSYL
jgi:uncharacterized membrane protein